VLGWRKISVSLDQPTTTHKIRWFCIVSSDRDFTPLIRYLKQAVAKVIGYGRKNALPILKNAYHQFINLEDLKPDQPAQPTLQVIEGKAA
jgi:uncharacterized LabA/DUF88 family protein